MTDLAGTALWTSRSPQQLGRTIHLLRLAGAVIRGRRGGLRTSPIRFADIGARGGLSRSWNILSKGGIVAPIFVEPEPTEAKALRAAYPGSQVLESALGERDEQGRTLHVTRYPGCTSLLTPAPSPNTPEGLLWMYEVEDEISLATRRSGDALAEIGPAPEVIKLDVQGFELGILKGLGPMLDEVVAVQLEVSFIPTYRDQPKFQEVFEFLADRGFGMTHLSAFGVAGTGAAIEGNALFGNRRLDSARSRLIEDIALAAIGGAYAA